MGQITDYELSDKGELTVNQESLYHYQYIDLTLAVEYLFNCVEKTIEEDFKKELDYLVAYDNTKTLIKEIVDMPSRLLDLFIHCVVQNAGTLSVEKKEKYFSMLTKDEIAQMEGFVQKEAPNLYLYP